MKPVGKRVQAAPAADRRRVVGALAAVAIAVGALWWWTNARSTSEVSDGAQTQAEQPVRDSDARALLSALGSARNTPAAIPRQVAFALEPGGAQITGRIVDAFGGPITGALVAAAGEQGGPGSTTVSDDDGAFALALDEGAWNVRASASGYDSNSALLRAPSAGATLVLAAAGSIRGRVLSAVDGAPVPGVEVRATKHARVTLVPGDASATSDAEGNFALESLAAGDYELIARGPHTYGGGSAKQHLAIGENATGIEIRVGPAVTVAGQVLLERSSEPCPSGSVTFTTAPALAPATADAITATAVPAAQDFAAMAPIASGAVLIEGVPAGEYRVEVSCPGYLARAEYERVHVQAADVRGLLWPVTHGLRVAGQLVDAQGRGVAARVVQALLDGEQAVGYAQAVTSSAGAFELLGLAPTRYRIQVENALENALANAPEATQAIDLSDGKSLRSPLRLTLRAAGMIEVHVTPAVAAATAVVQAVGPEAQMTALRVAADRLELRDLPAGEYRVYASDGRNQPQERSVNVTAGARAQVSFALPHASAVLSGQVIDQSGAPVADVAVTAVPSHAPALPGPELKSAVFTQADGSFVIPDLIAGEAYNVEAQHRGDGSAAVLDAVAGGTIVLRLADPS